MGQEGNNFKSSNNLTYLNTKIKEHNEFLTVMFPKRRQGQQGILSVEKYPPTWTDNTRQFYEYIDFIQGLTHPSTSDEIDYMLLTALKKEWMDEYHTLAEEYLDYHHERVKQLRIDLGHTKRHAGHELGVREFTLTYSPSWFDEVEARFLMSRAIDRLMEYYKDDIIRFTAVGEVGENGLSHVHAYYELRGGLKISNKSFKRAYPNWNPSKTFNKAKTSFEGGHHETIRGSVGDFASYIEKNKNTPACWLYKKVSKIES